MPRAIHGAGGGVLVRCIARTCTGLVWVRSTLRSPAASGVRKKVSCSSRAGWRGGKLRAVKLWKSSSMSGPSASAKPISAKIATISSITCITGWTQPLRWGGAGRERSRAPAARSASSAAASSAARRSPIWAATRSRRPLRRGPSIRRSSGLMPARFLRRPETTPLLPSASRRIASRAGRSAAAPMRVESWASRAFRSVIGWNPGHGEEEGASGALVSARRSSLKRVVQPQAARAGADLVGDDLERGRVGAGKNRPGPSGRCRSRPVQGRG